MFLVTFGIGLCERQSTCLAVDNPPVSSLDRILLNIKDREQRLKTFTASFKQTQKNALLKDPLISEGMMFYDQSGKILMKIIRPEAFVLLINDRSVILEDPVSNTFKQKTLPGRNTFIKRYLGTGQSLEALKDTYDIRISRACTDRDCQLEIAPKKRSRNMPFQSIRLTVGTRMWLPQVIFLEEPNGDTTMIEITYHTINDPLPADTFRIGMLKEGR
jgi:outer membrane lipoprotein carrier protein